MTNKNFADRLEQIIALADKTSASVKHPSGIGHSTVNGELFNELRSSSLSFIKNLYGDNHPYYIDFNGRVLHAYPSDTSYARGILKAIKSEIDGGWLVTMKGIVSAEIFSDFLDMASHLLTEGYKDPAAVMIGSVL